MLESLKNIPNTIRHFFVKVSRSIQYAIIGYKSEDYDYEYLYELLQFKLKRMYNLFKKSNIAVGDKKNADQIESCIILLEELIQHEENLYKEYDKLAKEYSIEHRYEEIEGRKGLLRMVTYSSANKSLEEYRKKVRVMANKFEIQYNKNLKELTEILRLNIRKWWN